MHLRAGWSLGEVQNTYLRYQAASDMHVGRTVCGLPHNSENFALLPPRFTVVDDIVEQGLKMGFGKVPQRLRHVMEFALASLVYHHMYLLETLAANHLLRRSPLLTQHGLVAQLRLRIECGLAKEGVGLTASGVPPHCSLLGKMQHVQDSVKDFQGSVVSDIIAGVEQTIGDRGGLSRALLESIITTTVERTGITALAASLQQPRDVEIEQNDNASGDGSGTMPYEWQGRRRRLPEKYELRDGTPRQMWSLWVCGSSKDRMPLRFVRSFAVDLLNTRKRLSDLRFLMCLMENAARVKGLSLRRISPVDACRIFEAVEDAISLSPTTQASRVRRSSQLSWRTHVNEIRHLRRA